MADVIRCPHCNARIYALQLPSGTRIELNATPDPNGVWALVKGEPVVAVSFSAGKVTGRIPKFEGSPLYSGHYGKACADAAAARVQALPGKKTGS